MTPKEMLENERRLEVEHRAAVDKLPDLERSAYQLIQGAAQYITERSGKEVKLILKRDAGRIEITLSSPE
jgi:hypothetical protein